MMRGRRRSTLSRGPIAAKLSRGDRSTNCFTTARRWDGGCSAGKSALRVAMLAHPTDRNGVSDSLTP